MRKHRVMLLKLFSPSAEMLRSFPSDLSHLQVPSRLAWEKLCFALLPPPNSISVFTGPHINSFHLFLLYILLGFRIRLYF